MTARLPGESFENYQRRRRNMNRATKIELRGRYQDGTYADSRGHEAALAYIRAMRRRNWMQLVLVVVAILGCFAGAVWLWVN